ncbi:MAG: uncharacterized protein KVP18_001857 [Porospora cf. gigantea A]|uniref:uncharacterized protein n=1 Tax=Porospora cf. gigantea A TaxID=2853593 RepID=UPI00355A0714|nr:MAG: hypothetical protein KVP18_001857 [Porospora cf. gigantea A]
MTTELAKRVFYYVEAVEAEEAADDEFDPFASESEDEAAVEEMKQKAAEIAAKKKEALPKKKVVVGKSSLVIEVRPGTSETDLDDVAVKIKAIKMDGVTWAESAPKKVPLAFGLMKLQVGCTIIDDLVETDKICENIEIIGMTVEQAVEYIKRRDEGTLDEVDDEEEQVVQCAEIVSFNKL